MDAQQAAVWVRVIRDHPDRCLIAADWFDEQVSDVSTRVGDALRLAARDGYEAEAWWVADRILTPAPPEVEFAIVSTLRRDQLAILNERAEVIVVGDDVVAVHRPPLGQKGRWVIPTGNGLPAKFGESVSDFVKFLGPAAMFEFTPLEIYRIAARHETMTGRYRWEYTIWAGLDPAGVCYVTIPPPPEHVRVIRDEPPIRAIDCMWCGPPYRIPTLPRSTE